MDSRHDAFDAKLDFPMRRNSLRSVAPIEAKVLILHPDRVFPPHPICRFSAFADTKHGFSVVGARQIPLVCPKRVDPRAFPRSYAVPCGCLFHSAANERCDETFSMPFDNVYTCWRIHARDDEMHYRFEAFVTSATKDEKNAGRSTAAGDVARSPWHHCGIDEAESA